MASPPNVFICRGVRRGKGFDEAAADIFGDVRKADDALMAFEHALARNPNQSSVMVAGTQALLALKTRASALGPAVIILFTHDDQYVDFLGILRADEEDDGSDV